MRRKPGVSIASVASRNQSSLSASRSNRSAPVEPNSSIDGVFLRPVVIRDTSRLAHTESSTEAASGPRPPGRTVTKVWVWAETSVTSAPSRNCRRSTACEARSSSAPEPAVSRRSRQVTGVAALRPAGRDLGEVLATCVSLLNPSVIVLGGSLAAVGDHLLAVPPEVVYTRSLPLATAHLTIALSRSADDAGILGASILVVQHVRSADAIETALALRA